MKLFNKVKWVLGITIIFVLILVTNLIDKSNFSRVKNSVETIYEDRLIAKDLIFKMSKCIQKKEIAVISSDSTFFSTANEQLNKDFLIAISNYETTKLTTEESKIFDDLKGNFNSIYNYEKNLSNLSASDQDVYKEKIYLLKENLNDLSEIQLIEGRKQMSISKRALETVELFTKIEIYILILLAIAIQIIIIYQPKEK